MAKKRKKRNYRLRKSVRRTLGALFLMSAIIVAAIPFPDAAATSQSGVVTQAVSNPLQAYAYVEKTSFTEDEKKEMPDLSGSGKNPNESLTIRVSSDGQHQLYKQFDYFDQEFDGSTYAVIKKYNSAFATETIKLGASIFIGYTVITTNEYNEFFKRTPTTDINSDFSQAISEGGNVTITYEEGKDNVKALFETLFSDKLETYKKELEEWNKNQIGSKPTLTIIPNNLDDNDKVKYYCYAKGHKDGNYTLSKVMDKRNTTSSEDVYVYLLKYNGTASNSLIVDNYGYVVEKTASIYAIGDKAFNEVTNVKYLTLPSEIRYIGKEAFSNCFLQDVTLEGVEYIDHQAFKKCTQLTTVTMNAVKQIGIEAFHGCTALKNIEFPYQIMKIGYGAFAKCTSLVNVDFTKATTAGLEVGEGAFYNCPLQNLAIGNSAIQKLAKGAFATSDHGNDKLISVNLEQSKITEIEDYVFSGRSVLKEVKMPNVYGVNEDKTLPTNIFQGCQNLELLEFPEVSGRITYDKSIFSDVLNQYFAVKGPAKKYGSSDLALERVATRSCMNASGEAVPYMYEENGQIYYEVISGDYLLSLKKVDDATASVSKCEFKDGVTSTPTGELNIPSNVGPYKVVKLDEGCFNDAVKGDLKKVIIKDDSLITIGDSVFEGCTNIAYVEIGNSVVDIGTRAFKGCSKLEEVRVGENVTNIGAEAFKDCIKLIKITFSNPVNGTASFPKENIGKDALTTGSESLTVIGVITQGYGPFEWAMEESNYVDKDNGVRVCYKSAEQLGMTVILDNRNNLATLIDYPQYNDLKTYTDTEGNIINLQEKYENNQEKMTPAELKAVESVLYIDVPAGVESIDVQGFLLDGNANGYNIERYKLNTERFTNYRSYGLFNGNTADDSASSAVADEKKELGNDRIKRVTMATVKYLPTNTQSTSSRATSAANDKIAQNGLAMGAFYSCEDLETVILGEAMEDVGELPFKGCYKLTNVSASDPFTCENGVLYEKSEEGTYKIVEVLGGKAGVINTTNNPLLAQTSEIAMGAFSDCLELKTVNFKNAEKLDEIPEKCFFGSDNLEVILTKQILRVGDFAFAESDGIVEVTVEGNTTSIPKNAFDGTKKAVVYALPDSAAYNAFSKAENVEVKIIEDYYTVRFVDYDGSTFEGEDYAVQEVEFMGYAKDPKITPTREKYVFTGWYPDYKTTPITKDQDFVAQYVTDEDYYNGGNGSGNNGGNGSGSNGGNGSSGGNNVSGGIDTDGDGIPDVDENGNKLYKLTVSNGEGSGYYPAGKTINISAGAASSGATFGYWSCSNSSLIFNDSTKPNTSLTMIADDVTVIANYVGQYTLEVVYGSGSGSYPAGTKVAISAVDAPQGRRFASWVSSTSGLTIESSTKATTVITMPASNAKVTATYADTGSISGNSTSNNKPSQNGTSIVITKDGISDKDKASAYVTGSSDNFVVKISESLDAADEVQKALQKKYPDMTRIKYFAMDISLYDAKGETKITDTTGLKVNITMPIPDALKDYAGNNRVGAVVNGELETLNPKFTTIDGVPSVSFTATHFSPYTIYVDTGNLTVSDTLDSTPKTGDAIHPKWFLSLGLACISVILFTKKDKRYTVRAYR